MTAAPAGLEVGEVAADDGHAGIRQRDRLRVVQLGEAAGADLRAGIEEGVLVDDALRPGHGEVRVGAGVVAALVVVVDGDGRGELVRPDRIDAARGSSPPPVELKAKRVLSSSRLLV